MTGVAASAGGEEATIGYGLLRVGTLLYFACAVVALVISAIMRKRQVVAGLSTWLGISIVSPGAACFVGNKFSGGYWF